MDLSADISLFYSDLAVAAYRTPAGGTVEPAPQLVLLDRAAQRYMGGDVVMASPSIQVPHATWPGLAKGDTLTIAGEVWRLIEVPQLTEDGAELVAPVALVRS